MQTCFENISLILPKKEFEHFSTILRLRHKIMQAFFLGLHLIRAIADKSVPYNTIMNRQLNQIQGFTRKSWDTRQGHY